MFRKSHTFILLSAIFLALFVAFMLPAVALAQPDPGSLETSPGGNPIVPLDFFEAALFTILTTAGGIAWGLFANAPVTEPIVQVIKYFVLLLPEWPLIKIIRNAPSNHIVMGVSGVLTLLSAAAAYFGFQLQFANALDVIRAIAAIIATLLAGHVGANGIFGFLNKRNVPLFGSARTPHQ